MKSSTVPQPTNLTQIEDERPYACDVSDCTKSFPRAWDLRRHKESHLNPNSQEFLQKAYVCDFVVDGKICGHKTLQKSNMQRHIKIHNDERLFACRSDGCEKAFTDRSGQILHERMWHEITLTKRGTPAEPTPAVKTPFGGIQEPSIPAGTWQQQSTPIQQVQDLRTLPTAPLYSTHQFYQPNFTTTHIDSDLLPSIYPFSEDPFPEGYTLPPFLQNNDISSAPTIPRPDISYNNMSSIDYEPSTWTNGVQFSQEDLTELGMYCTPPPSGAPPGPTPYMPHYYY